MCDSKKQSFRFVLKNMSIFYKNIFLVNTLNSFLELKIAVNINIFATYKTITPYKDF